MLQKSILGLPSSFALESIRPWEDLGGGGVPQRGYGRAIRRAPSGSGDTPQRPGCNQAASIRHGAQIYAKQSCEQCGARNALYGNNTDRARHILSSLGNCGTIFLGDWRPMIASAHVFRVCLIRRSAIEDLLYAGKQLVALGFSMFAES